VRDAVLELCRGDTNQLKKVHSDFDIHGSGHLTIDEMTNMIAKLKISVDRKYVHPFFKIIDANNSGGIEFEEFEVYIVKNPY
jgi:Ca2+-binding EF-hand superfamily protein